MSAPAKKHDARSPYQRYGKSPFRYSDLHQRWRAALARNDVPEVRRLAAEHNRRFALSPNFTSEAA